MRRGMVSVRAGGRLYGAYVRGGSISARRASRSRSGVGGKTILMVRTVHSGTRRRLRCAGESGLSRGVRAPRMTNSGRSCDSCVARTIPGGPGPSSCFLRGEGPGDGTTRKG